MKKIKLLIVALITLTFNLSFSQGLDPDEDKKPALVFVEDGNGGGGTINGMIYRSSASGASRDGNGNATPGGGTIWGNIGDWSVDLVVSERSPENAASSFGGFRDNQHPLYQGDDVLTQLHDGMGALGWGSFAANVYNRASGAGSVAMGFNNIAGGTSGVGPFNGISGDNVGQAVFGWGSRATGTVSFASGERNTASGSKSVAMGNFNYATGDSTISLGKENWAEGASTVAVGFKNHAAGGGSVALGQENVAWGTTNFTSGYQNTAGDTNAAVGTAGSATAMGKYNTASGRSSFAGNRGTKALNQASASLAVEKGPSPIYNEKKYMQCPFIQESLSENTRLAIKEKGLRNIAIMSIAPTGSISNIVLSYQINGKNYIGVSGGVEPIFATYYNRRSESFGNKTFKVFHSTIQAYIDKMSLNDKIQQAQSIEEIEEILPHFLVRTAHKIDSKKRVVIQGAIQKYIDHSISSTINLAEDVEPEVISDIYFDAWKEKLKGVTVYREGSRHPILSTEGVSATDFQKAKNNVYNIIENGEEKSVLGDDVLKLPDGSLTTVYHYMSRTQANEEIITEDQKEEIEV